jgi:hypothetical protein
MNFEFIKGGKTGEEVAEKHGGGCFRVAMLGEESDKTKLG